MLPTAPGVIVNAEEHEEELHEPLEDVDDSGGLRLPDDAVEVPDVEVEGGNVEVGEPEELDEDDPRVPGRQEKLQTEAGSVLHKLTHLPKNPFCDSCQRGKMKEKYSRRGAFKRNVEKWCEQITFDHLLSSSERAIGVDGETAGFVVRDIYTGIVHAYPVMDQTTANVVLSL